MIEIAIYAGVALIFAGMFMRWFSSLFAENRE